MALPPAVLRMETIDRVRTPAPGKLLSRVPAPHGAPGSGMSGTLAPQERKATVLNGKSGRQPLGHHPAELA